MRTHPAGYGGFRDSQNQWFASPAVNRPPSSEPIPIFMFSTRFFCDPTSYYKAHKGHFTAVAAARPRLASSVGPRHSRIPVMGPGPNAIHGLPPALVRHVRRVHDNHFVRSITGARAEGKVSANRCNRLRYRRGCGQRTSPPQRIQSHKVGQSRSRVPPPGPPRPPDSHQRFRAAFPCALCAMKSSHGDIGPFCHQADGRTGPRRLCSAGHHRHPGRVSVAEQTSGG